MAEVSSKSGNSISPSTILFILAIFGVGAPLVVSATHSTTPPIIASVKPDGDAIDETSAVSLIEQFFATDQNSFVVDPSHLKLDATLSAPPEDQGWGLEDPRRYDQISFVGTLERSRTAALAYWLRVNPPLAPAGSSEKLEDVLQEERNLIEQLRGANFLALRPALPRHFQWSDMDVQ
jgi:hypothetical protein